LNEVGNQFLSHLLIMKIIIILMRVIFNGYGSYC